MDSQSKKILKFLNDSYIANSMESVNEDTLKDKLNLDSNELNIIKNQLVSDGYLTIGDDTFDGEILEITEKGRKLFKNK